LIERICRHSLCLLALFGTILLSPVAQADDVPLVVNVFPGLSNLPIFAALDTGLFSKRRLAVEIQNTPNSQTQRDGLAQGKFQIAYSAVDNAVYMSDSGAADVVIVSGGSDGLNQLIVQPTISSVEDIRGGTVVVDATNTAYAFQLYRILELNGVKKADYTIVPKGGTPLRLKSMIEDKANFAGILNPPWLFLAEKHGLKSLGPAVKFIGPYQADGAWVLRSWAKEHTAILVKYLEAFTAGMRWVMDPKNRAAAITMLADHLKIDPDLAALSVSVAVGNDGLSKDASFDMNGFENVLKLRAKFGDTGKAPDKPEAYVDLSYYRQALKGM
jgi:ABC-type nitrate/sulfonate/bicarbonate transport system substrate-binding protein